MRERERKKKQTPKNWFTQSPGQEVSEGRSIPRPLCRLPEAAAALGLRAGRLETEGEGGKDQPQPRGW